MSKQASLAGCCRGIIAVALFSPSLFGQLSVPGRIDPWYCPPLPVFPWFSNLALFLWFTGYGLAIITVFWFTAASSITSRPVFIV